MKEKLENNFEDSSSDNSVHEWDDVYNLTTDEIGSIENKMDELTINQADEEEENMEADLEISTNVDDLLVTSPVIKETSEIEFINSETEISIEKNDEENKCSSHSPLLFDNEINETSDDHQQIDNDDEHIVLSNNESECANQSLIEGKEEEPDEKIDELNEENEFFSLPPPPVFADEQQQPSPICSKSEKTSTTTAAPARHLLNHLLSSESDSDNELIVLSTFDGSQRNRPVQFKNVSKGLYQMDYYQTPGESTAPPDGSSLSFTPSPSPPSPPPQPAPHKSVVPVQFHSTIPIQQESSSFNYQSTSAITNRLQSIRMPTELLNPNELIVFHQAANQMANQIDSPNDFRQKMIERLTGAKFYRVMSQHSTLSRENILRSISQMTFSTFSSCMK